MKLKVFVPDWDNQPVNRYCTPLLYAFLQCNLSTQTIHEKYGDWVNDIILVNNIQDSDVAILKYEMNYYYDLRKVNELKIINRSTIAAGKLLVCTTKGDVGITPALEHFHLYRWSGYNSKNSGNNFILPVFIADPLPFHNKGQITYRQKTVRPMIGFCGQGKGDILKWGKDVFRIFYFRGMKLMNKYYSDNEPLQSSTYTRSKLLDSLEKSPHVDTCFIRHKKYRNGIISKEEKVESAKIFFSNILDTQYTLCYRGAGNFSVRLFETLACGRIPVIILSDNMLPLPDKVDWNRFPIIKSFEKNDIAQKVCAFHNNLNEDQFIHLQQYARQIWEQYLTYSGFMRIFTDNYIKSLEAQHSQF